MSDTSDSDADFDSESTALGDSSDSSDVGDSGDSDADTDPEPTDEDGDGWTVEAGDCDDLSAEVHPEALESCLTAFDDDCDDEANEADASECTIYAIDEDGDGFGADTGLACLCEASAPYTATVAGDCDDADPARFPGGVRCRFSGAYSVDDTDLSLSGEAAGDSSANSVAFAGDIDGDGTDDLIVGALQESTNGKNSGAAYLVNSPLSGAVSLSSAGAKIMGECVDCFLGLDVSGVGDTDGDGYDDILVGEPGLPDGELLTVGAAFLFRGPLAGALYVGGESSDADARLAGGQGATGQTVAPAGDQDLDGMPDMLLGQPYNGSGPGGENAGRAFVVGGSAAASVDLEDAVAVLYGEVRADCAGFALDGGKDLDGDGVADVTVGSYLDDDAGYQAGAAYLARGPVGGETSLGDAEVKVLGEDTGDQAGWGAALVTDVDGDGNADLLVGAHGEDLDRYTGGAAYLVTSPSDGSSSLSDATAKLDGEIRSGWVGFSVSGAGDLDQDGYGDLLVGSWADTTWLVYGPVTGTLSLDDADASWTGAAGTSAGYVVAGDGDADADGVPDFLIGAPWDSTAGTGAGMTYLILGAGP